jgi:hypothetical protein
MNENRPGWPVCHVYQEFRVEAVPQPAPSDPPPVQVLSQQCAVWVVFAEEAMVPTPPAPPADEKTPDSEKRDQGAGPDSGPVS